MIGFELIGLMVVNPTTDRELLLFHYMSSPSLNYSKTRDMLYAVARVHRVYPFTYGSHSSQQDLTMSTPEAPKNVCLKLEAVFLTCCVLRLSDLSPPNADLSSLPHARLTYWYWVDLKK